QPWSIEFSAPDESRTLDLTIRRDPTAAFDRNIDGHLWLDDLYLIPETADNADAPWPESLPESLPGLRSGAAEEAPHG
ncbi:MAG: hypothetical protein LC637_03170, partial [Xanthomonadaceae bacterium]|nr:hypothetical protein [Xanthomonadaceae bacterium]